MSYTKQTWASGQVITATKLNHIEDGIAAVEAEIPSSAADVGAIPAPVSPTSGQFLQWNGSAWVAASLPVYNGGVS